LGASAGSPGTDGGTLRLPRRTGEGRFSYRAPEPVRHPTLSKNNRSMEVEFDPEIFSKGLRYRPRRIDLDQVGIAGSVSGK
jgi:hypothetical protein